ncbi:DEAD/DEAH box helicase [Chryseobacterium lactis]|uniref:DEAD/DEAH box helicase n=1 Tax=Chryseobacterium lactis TaxID=1241981 RepID=A0A3G6RLA3_CHRLC|nr:DEAD/DEAH box helicase [Chryseobacterium lactis]AZA83614.1 DEAD/DEAH box helicase [Chryseobacterium lactis]AZB03999.1 DEAD/DEAH box helicase [Chryseobacterium lactis]PNW13092.1 DEAD/DEAH box helicase [Chryseobacterium lactis]
MTAFDLLSEPIRKYIRDKKWESLRPIQDAAIQRIIPTDYNYILISRTASGKTEAAFLPILSKVNFKEPGVKVLYISPLIALINDQFVRVESLCEYLDVPVTKWHGEAAKGAKDRLLKNPEGIVLITPESLEAMFVNKPYHIKHLFSTLEYVVIDEIHSFLGSDRGTHLQSLLNRLQRINTKKFSIVGLSATVSDTNQYIELKDFLGDQDRTRIIRDTTPKPINVVFKYFEGSVEELPLPLLKDLYTRTRDSKVLIFPNARGRVEEVAVKLKQISERVGGHKNYFSHHSSVDKEVREYVEFFAKNSSIQNFCISCTSTLELGIDIGNVDEVVQIDATHSIASLIQRVGRSGRREGKASNLFLYATEKWSLLQSLACWLLYQEQYIEPIAVNEKPYDVLVHQILSIVKGTSGISLPHLLNEITTNSTFLYIKPDEIEDIITHLISIDFLEKLGHELIIGVEGEEVVNSRDFYSLFETPVFFKVASNGVKIGELPLSPQIRENENIYLSAKIWSIIDIDFQTRKIEVIPAMDGRKPKFYGSAANIAFRIREKMFEIVMSKEDYGFMDETGKEVIAALRKEFSVFKINDFKIERPLLVSNDHLTFYSFTSSKINKTLRFILDQLEIENTLDDEDSTFKIESLTASELNAVLKNIDRNQNIDQILTELLENIPEIIDFSKWGKYLPIQYQAALLKEKHFDFKGCYAYLDQLVVIENNIN